MNKIKKVVFLYQLLIILICFVLNIFDIINLNFFLVAKQIILVLGLYYLIKLNLDYTYRNGILFIFVFNLLQIFSFTFSGILYKLSFGPQIFLSLYNTNDWYLDIELFSYSNVFFLKVSDSSNIFFIGINIVQMFLAIYSFFYFKKNIGD